MVETPKKKKELGRGRAAFLALGPAIGAEISAGRMKADVWREYRERLGGLGYIQFTRYVTRYIPKPKHSLKTATPPAPPPSSLNEKQSLDNPHKAERAKRSTTFHFDPMEADIKKYV